MATATRTFRIFVSSTFSDLKAERNALQQHVFPQLRQLCLKHGTRFQAVDLRWGVRDEAALDQRTMQICLDEIARSRRASPRPNFIVLLGDRYGWRPLPAEIPAGEFSVILARTSSAGDRELLGRWYRQDDNAVPARFWLQPRALDLTTAKTDEQRELLRKAEAASWAQTEESLRGILSVAVAKAPIDAPQKEKYSASATEQEIVSGALRVDDADEHVFGFFRSVRGMPDDFRAAEYRDIDADGRVDGNAAALLEDLKARLRARLPRSCFAYEARWAPPTQDSSSYPVSTDHLPRLCADALEALTGVILREIAALEQVSEFDREVADHESFAHDRAHLFVGRAGVLRTIDAYMRGDDRHPLAIVGASGSGKSAVMARALQQAQRDHPAAVIVSRFIGATPASSDVRALLERLFRQIARAYSPEERAIPTDYRELVQEFPKLLALAHASRPLIVFLDALDQLSDAERARSLAWMPVDLPPHVRVVVSAMEGECEQALRRRLPAANMTLLEPMPSEEGSALLDVWLEDAGRRLTADQRRAVLSAFAESEGSPLYLKLAFEEARRWRSTDRNVVLSPGISGIIQDLFTRLSGEHGSMLVSRALACLAAAKNGLSEDEMLDLLSMDTDVFKDFIERAHHTPPEPRLPVVVWSRLYFDLEPYLTERRADNATLMTFYHRQLQEVAVQAYLNPAVSRERHELLARYFGDQSLFEPQTNAPNLRKLSELPFQQTRAEQWDKLYATLTDFDFLEAKCTHAAVTEQRVGGEVTKIYGGVYELQEDYRRALERFPAS